MDTEVAPSTLYCSQCGQATDASAMAKFGDVMVCANCKNAYAQRLREGAASASLVTRQPAGFWRRAAAALIDGLILFVIQLVITLAAAPLMGGDDAGLGIGLGFLVYGLTIAASATYEAVLVHQYAATPGKMAMGIEVLRPDGSRLSLGRAFARHFAKWVSSIVLGIGYLMVAFTANKRGLHDMMCDTNVVKSH